MFNDYSSVKAIVTTIATVAIVESFEAITGIKLWSVVPAAAGALVGISMSDKMARKEMAIKFISAILFAGYTSQTALRLLPEYYEEFRVMSETNLRVMIAFAIAFLVTWGAPFITKFIKRKAGGDE